MSPRFGVDKIMGAALATGVAGTALTPEDAHAGGYSAESQQMAAHADQVLEQHFPGYNFEVAQNPMSVKPDFQIKIQDEQGGWLNGGRVNPPSGMSGIELDGYLKKEVEKMLKSESTSNQSSSESAPDHDSVESIVESMNITPAAQAMIRAMGGNPEPFLEKDAEGKTVVKIKLNNATKDTYVIFDASTASAWIGPEYDDAGNQILRIKCTNEDGSQESVYWNADGTFGG